MSYIHEALKKAQKEKNNQDKPWPSPMSAVAKQKRTFTKKGLLQTLLVTIILLAFACYSWLDFSTPKASLTSEQKQVESLLQLEDITEAKFFYDRARGLHKDGRLRDAEKSYLETLRIDPDHADALNNLGVIYIHERNYPDALARLEKSIRLKPEHFDPYYNLACLYAIKGDIELSLTNLSKAVSIEQSVKEWARRDTDLKNLRGKPEYEELINTGR